MKAVLIIFFLSFGILQAQANENKIIKCTNSDRDVFATIDLVGGHAYVTDIRVNDLDFRSSLIDSLSGGVFEFRNSNSKKVLNSVAVIFNAVMMKAQVRYETINNGKPVELNKCSEI